MFTTKRTYTLQAATQIDRNKWVTVIQNALSLREKEKRAEADLGAAREVFQKWKWDEDAQQMVEVEFEMSQSQDLPQVQEIDRKTKIFPATPDECPINEEQRSKVKKNPKLSPNDAAFLKSLKDSI